MTEDGVATVLWWLGLVAAPAVLIGIELFHPAHFTGDPGMFQFLSKPEPYDPRYVALSYPGPGWWFALHMVQTPMVGLIAVGLWLLVARVGDANGVFPVTLAWLSRAATLVFLIYYTALDSIGGTGLGRLLINTEAMAASGQLTPEQVRGIALLVNATWTDPWVGGVGSLISETGSYAVLAAAVFSAASLWLARKAPWPPLVMLLAFGWQLQTSHASPHGPLAFSLLIVAALWIWRSTRQTARPDTDRRPFDHLPPIRESHG
jgi:hypothetical protein